MTSLKNEELSFVVADVILEQQGKFTIEDILNKVRKRIKTSIENLKEYIVNKLNSMCEYGLIGRTNVYYFSV
ncbi:hypothetical protein HW276_11400 [Leptotrichia sp. oral taxon 417]|jgi:hypothetical protein|uniref:hypothetical protein n=1 Tax=Leptotrichia sp. oral taxon 417 TaxID=712365 RepID=UPI0015BF9C3B|nr:hypothetical protein [Leptotrichia sp. oral taxon 417]NWO28293.1 hypothetical protein [Leptotrichia sp. oral taxon 417]